MKDTKGLPQKCIYKALQEAASRARTFQSHHLAPLQEQSRALSFIITVIKYLQRLTDISGRAAVSQTPHFPGQAEVQASRQGSQRGEVSCRAAAALSDWSKHAHPGSGSLLSGHRTQSRLPLCCPHCKKYTQEQAEGLSTLRTQEQGSERAPMPAQASRGLELPRTGREQPRTPTPTLASSLQSVTVQTGNYPSLSMDRQADCEHLHGRKGTDCRSVQPGLSPKGHTDMCGQQTQKAEHTLCDLRAGSSRAGRRSTGR